MSHPPSGYTALILHHYTGVVGPVRDKFVAGKSALSLYLEYIMLVIQ